MATIETSEVTVAGLLLGEDYRRTNTQDLTGSVATDEPSILSPAPKVDVTINQRQMVFSSFKKYTNQVEQ